MLPIAAHARSYTRLAFWLARHLPSRVPSRVNEVLVSLEPTSSVRFLIGPHEQNIGLVDP